MDQEMEMNNITITGNNKLTDKTSLKSVVAGPIKKHEKIKLISCDGEEFVLDYECALQSETIRTLLESSPNWIENESGIIQFPCIEGKILRKVVEYMLYKQAHIDELVEEFFIEPEMALDMMLAADYLDL